MNMAVIFIDITIIILCSFTLGFSAGEAHQKSKDETPSTTCPCNK